MQRGERNIQLLVLVLVGIIGVLSTLTLYTHSPTGEVFQGHSVYTKQPVAWVYCQQGQAFFTGTVGDYNVYCCPEDVIGQNDCRLPQRILQR